MKALSVFTAIVLSLGIAGELGATPTTITWDNAGTDFSAAGDWTGGTPSVTTSAQFTGTPGIQPSLTANATVYQIVFGSTGGWTLGSGSSSYALTLNPGANGIGIDASALTSGSDTISANLVLGSAQIWQVGAGGSLNLTGVVSGNIGNTAALTFGATGYSGTIIISGANTYQGINTITGGTVELSGSSATLGSTGNQLTGSATGTLNLNGQSLTVGSLLGSEAITNTGGAASTLTLNGSSAFVYSGAIGDGGGSSTLALVDNDTNTEQFSGTQTYSGGTTINAGTLRVNSSGFGTGTITLNNSAGFQTATSASGTIANAIAVNGTNSYIAGVYTTFTGAFSGSGTLKVSNNDGTTFQNNLTGFSGDIDVEYNSTSTAKYVALTTGVTGTGNTAWTLGTTTLGGANVLEWNSASATPVTVALGSLTGNANGKLTETANSTTAIYQVGALNQTTTFNGEITDGGGGRVAGLQMVGTGELTLAGVGAYSGGTTVTSGTLNAVGAAASTQAATITSGSTTVTMASTAGLAIGQSVSGAGIPSGDYIAAITSTGITLNAAATATGTSITFAAGNPLGTGAIAVNGGTLLIGSSYALSGAIGAISVTSGSLASSVAAENVANKISVSGGAVDLSSAASILTLSSGSAATDSLTMTSGSLNFYIGSSTANSSQILGSAGSVFTLSGGTIDLNPNGINYGAIYALLSGFTSGTESGLTIAGYDTADYTAVLTDNAGTLDLSFDASAVPEPPIWALLLGAGGLFLFLRRLRGNMAWDSRVA